MADVTAEAPGRGEPLAGKVVGGIGGVGFALDPTEARQLAQRLIDKADRAELEGAPSLPAALQAQVAVWERAADQLRAIAGEQPASVDEIEADASATIYDECAAAVRGLAEQFPPW